MVATGSEGRERELLQLFSGVPFAENLRLVMNLSVKPGVNQNIAVHALHAAKHSAFLLLLLFVCLFGGRGGELYVCVWGGGDSSFCCQSSCHVQ